MKIEGKTRGNFDVVVMVQGDEPMLCPEMIDLAVDPLLKDSEVNITNLMSKHNSVDEENDPNEIKVVVDQNGNALYFSREAIPPKKKGSADL